MVIVYGLYVSAVDLGLRWEQTGKLVAENTARIEKVETKVEIQEAKGDKFKKELKKTKEELSDLRKSIATIKEDTMKSSLAEIGEREANRSNVILHRVPESASSEPSERQAHDLDMLNIILSELGLTNIIKAELREGLKFVRRIGEKKEQQEARPMKVGFTFFRDKERLMESARNLNQIPSLQQITIANDLTEMQRKEETSLWRKAGDQNLSPTSEMTDKGLVMKVVGPRGQRRMIMAPLRRNEEVDEEGRVRLRVGSRRREGAGIREQEEGGDGHGAPSEPTSGANREPLGRKEQGNGQGAAGGRSRREEQEEQLRQGREKRKRPDRRSQSSASWEEEEGRGREKGRKEDSPTKSLEDYPDVRLVPVRREERGEGQGHAGLGGHGGRSRLAAPGGLKTTAPFRSSSLLQPRVSTPVAGSKTAPPVSK